MKENIIATAITLPVGSAAEKMQEQRFIPSGFTLMAVAGRGEGVVYGADKAAIGYSGKSAKRAFYYRFQNNLMRDRYIEQWCAGIEAKLKRKEEEKAAKQAFRHSYEVGDILACSWGWEQTNVDFYQVVSKTDCTITVREINKTARQEDTFMSGWTKPLPGQFIDGKKPITARVRECHRGEGKGSIKITSYSWAYYTPANKQHRESWYG